ncbi:DUF3048 domain-containing protein [Candidatus Saccharibacteria bacterium]|nr:DUF3048 domain-containing protein [Candidatus Saccharibacteria bacterium]
MNHEKNKNATPFNQYENYSPGHTVNPDIKKLRFQRTNTWLHSHRILVLIAVVILALGIGGSYIYGINSLVFYSSTGDPITAKKEVEKIYSPLTGAEVSEDAAKRPVTAIMIENSPESRPQSGLKEAGVVFEAIAEGGITRFLTLHQEDQPQLIGPVRSLRPYYIDWLAPFDPSVAHVGGSVKALAEIRNGDYKDIDQFSNGNSYWRAKDRYAPHNVYTSFERLDALNQKKGYTSSSFTGFPRTEDTVKKVSKTKNNTTATTQVPATKITVTVSGPLYNSSYTYDAATNTYARSQGGKIHTDREKGAITPSTIIVMESPISQVFEDGYREQYKTIGTGKATIFQNGTVVTGTWNKASKKAQIAFKDASGKDIKLVRGQTWITVVDIGKTPTWQ